MKITILTAILAMAPLSMASVASAQSMPDVGSPGSGAGISGPIVPDNSSNGSPAPSTGNNQDGTNGGINPSDIGTGDSGNPLGPGAQGQPAGSTRVTPPAPQNNQQPNAPNPNSVGQGGGPVNTGGGFGDVGTGAAPSAGELQEVTGTVVGATPTTLTLQDNGQQLQFGIGRSTSFLQDGQVVSGSELKEGQTVRAALAPNRGVPFAVAVAIPAGGSEAQNHKVPIEPEQAPQAPEGKACHKPDSSQSPGTSNQQGTPIQQDGNISIYRW